MEIKSLIERIEKSEGADREIDALIYHDLLGFCRHARKVKTGAQSDTGFDCLDCGADSWGNKSRKGGYPAGQGLHDSAPRYTASIDAAMTLVEPRALWAHGSMEDGPFARICWPRPDGTFTDSYFETNCATVPLSICACALEARNPSHEG